MKTPTLACFNWLLRLQTVLFASFIIAVFSFDCISRNCYVIIKNMVDFFEKIGAFLKDCKAIFDLF